MHSKQLNPEEIIIFTRYPEPGKVKTRLVPYLGEEDAALLQRRLTEQTIRLALPLHQEKQVRISIFFTGGSEEQMKKWLNGSVILKSQDDGDIGQRMASALRSAWSRGAHRAVLVGSDLPALKTDILAQALKELRTCDVVLGPAHDGGYYLIGLNNNLPAEKFNTLFNGLDWGTSSVFSQTLQKAEQEHLTVAILERLHDIDRPEDLKHFCHHSDPQ